jgi:hypothetical protein
MPESDGTKVPDLMLKRPRSGMRRLRSKNLKLKGTAWYEQAARSVQISSKRMPKERDETIE